MLWDQFKAFFLTSWKTTVAGVVTFLTALAAQNGVIVSEAAQDQVTVIILGLGMALVGLFSKDGDKSGSPRE